MKNPNEKLSPEEIHQLLSTISVNHKNELYQWLQENLLTKHETIVYTDQSEHGLKQSVRDHQLEPFFSKGEGRSKINLFLKNDAIDYGKRKRKNVLKGTKRP